MKYKSAESNPTYQTQSRRDLRNNSTSAEAMLWRYLKGSQAGGYKFRRQHGIGPYIMDFYCPMLRLGIELDGSVHEAPMADEKDEIRTRFLNEQGVTILRFKNEVVWMNPRGIVNEIVRFGEEWKKGYKRL